MIAASAAWRLPLSDEAGTAVGEIADQIALATDLYELTMGAAYLAHEVECRATFSLFVRRLPARRSFLVAAGLSHALRRLEALRFSESALAYLRSTGQIRPEFIDWLRDLKLSLDVRAVPEGRVVFENEPLLEVSGPIIQAQLVETLLLTALHFPTLVATKAARYVAVAQGRQMVEFGLRRTASVDAGLASARAAYLAGFVATSNLLAGERYGIPVSGTMAHSFVQVFPSELDAFRAFAESFPGPVTLLIDTYDIARGAARAIEIGHELARQGRSLAAVRIDSGDLGATSRDVRRQLDEAGLKEVRIIVSGGLDEADVEALVAGGVPIDAFGVGTRLGTSSDAPSLEMVYKLVEYDDHYRVKLSPGKATIAGSKQVWRRRDKDGLFREDLLALADEPTPGPEWAPLLVPVMRSGRRLARPSLEVSRQEHAREMASLPPEVKRLDRPLAYPVTISARLASVQASTVESAGRVGE